MEYGGSSQLLENAIMSALMKSGYGPKPISKSDSLEGEGYIYLVEVAGCVQHWVRAKNGWCAVAAVCAVDEDQIEYDDHISCECLSLDRIKGAVYVDDDGVRHSMLDECNRDQACPRYIACSEW